MNMAFIQMRQKLWVLPNFTLPNNVTELKRILAMIHYLGRYFPNLSETAKPLNDLLKKLCHMDMECNTGGSLQEGKKNPS